MMRRTLTILACAAFSVLTASAQDGVQDAIAEAARALAAAPREQPQVQKPSLWKKSASFDLGVSNTTFDNWAAGGYDNFSMSTSIDANADYAKGLMLWTNRLQMDYSFLFSEDKRGFMQKTNDVLYFQSKWAYKTSKTSKFNFSASFDFKSQFSDGLKDYKQDTDGNWTGTLKSAFLSPAYTNIALGIDWVPSNWINLNIAPLTGGFTICTDTRNDLRKTYGMPEDGQGGYSPALFQFGTQVKTNVKLIINDNLRYETQVVIFSDYLNEPYFRFNWDNSVAWQIHKRVKLAFKTWMIYDPLVMIDGRKRVQFKEFLSFNFTYSLTSKK